MTRRLHGFDGLRAVAALTVLCYHVLLFQGFTRHGALAPLLAELKAGVGIFFVISGALLYLPFARSIRDRSALPDWRQFASRRVVRILPAYWLALTIFLFGPFGASWLGPDLWRYYGLAEIYNPQTLMQGLGVAWSLCVEATFYVLLPLFAAAMCRLTRTRGGRPGARVQLVGLGVLGCVTLVVRLLAAGSVSGPIPSARATLVIALPGFLDWFALGMALAVLAAELEAGRRHDSLLARLAGRPALCVTGALALMGVGVPFEHGDLFLPLYGMLTHITVGLASGLLVLVAIGPQGEPGRTPAAIRLLTGRRLAWLGTISYGVYLWHVPILRLLVGRPDVATLPKPPLTTLLIGFTVLIGAIVLGAASWYLVEQPLQRITRARGGPRRPPATPATSSPLAPVWTR